jgi:multidrug resistance efflux pump
VFLDVRSFCGEGQNRFGHPTVSSSAGVNIQSAEVNKKMNIDANTNTNTNRSQTGDVPGGNCQSLTSRSSRDAPETIPTHSSSITKEEVEKARAELQKSLKVEQFLSNLNMQLQAQLGTLKASIATAESETKLAKLALQQAKVVRLLRAKDESATTPDLEPIIINPFS